MPIASLLNSLIKTIPKKPGVYKFYDQDHEIIYVGKAKNLNKRVASYFIKTHKNLKTKNLVSRISDVKCIVVETEIDALLLENNLIKQYQPKYNVLLKDDKSYPWICISNERFPRVFQTRTVVKNGSEYYGPYMSTRIVSVLLDYFSDIFYDRGWTPISYLNREIDVESRKKYLNTVSEIRQILKGDITAISSKLKERMAGFSKSLDFENAQKTKDQLSLLNNYQSKSLIVSSKINSVDVLCSKILLSCERLRCFSKARILQFYWR